MLIYLLLKIKWLWQKKWKEEKEYLRLIALPVPSNA